jgi:hypothetical protein
MNKNGFTLVELIIGVLIPLVLSWQISVICIDHFKINELLLIIIFPFSFIILGFGLFFIHVETYKYQNKILSIIFPILFYIFLVCLFCYLMFFFKNTLFYFINSFLIFLVTIICVGMVKEALKKQ